MNMSAYKEGEQAYYESVGFIANPYPIAIEEDRFKSWSRGWWDVHNRLDSADQEQIKAQIAKEVEQERLEIQMKKKQKSKKGRAELAGQATMF